MKKISISIIFMLLLVSSVLGATIPSRYTLDFYNQNGILNLTTITTTNATINNLNVGNGTNAGNISANASGVYINGVNLFFGLQKICLQNGTNCQASTPEGGWTNTTTTTSTNLDVGINIGSPLFPLDVILTSTSEKLRVLSNVSSQFAGTISLDKIGNATSQSGIPENAAEIGTVDSRVWNGSTFTRRALMQFVTSIAHVPSGNAGVDIVFYNTPRNDPSLKLAMQIRSSGVVIGNTSTSNPSDRLVVQGNLNVTGTLKFTNLTGSGNDYVCVDATGTLYRSDTACA